ncbi:MAG: rRNA processing protein RimM [Eubacteriaceae bacterium]|jgi:16S rRNA processing protein RimM|nr:rRNA processing protein RimM [Eubacteriaceae bacterium]
MKKETMIIGRVAGVHGIKGEVKVQPLTDNSERFFDLREIILVSPKENKKVIITACRIHKNSVLLQLDGIASRNEAEALIGMNLLIDRDQAVDLSDDEYFVEDLKGMSVYNQRVLLGELTDILQTGGVDVYMIKGEDREYCVPARKIYFKDFDFENNRIEADIPQEILEL